MVVLYLGQSPGRLSLAHSSRQTGTSGLAPAPRGSLVREDIDI